MIDVSKHNITPESMAKMLMSSTTTTSEKKHGPGGDKIANMLGIVDETKKVKKGVENLLKEWKKIWGGSGKLKKFIEAGLRPGSLNVHDKKLEFAINKLAGLSKATFSAIKQSQFNQRTRVGGSTNMTDDSDSFAAQRAKTKAIVKNMADSISRQLMGGFDVSQLIFGGVIAGQLDYIMNMRKIAFVTEGVSGETKGLQHQWEKVGWTVSETGFAVSVFQKNLVSNLRKGIRNSDEIQKITKTSLNLAKMIDSEADSTAGFFSDWKISLGMSANQMDDLARGMQFVARETGVMGDQLIQVAKSSEQFLKNMRFAGTLTANMSKNMIMLSALAQQSGVDITGIQGGLSSTVELLLKSSKETKTLLFASAHKVGRVQDLVHGTLMDSKQGIGDLGKGMEQLFKQFTRGFGVDDINKMSAGQKMRANLALNAIGQTLEGMATTVRIFKEGGETYAEKLEKIDKQIKEKNLTSEEKRILVLKKQDMLLGASLEQASALSEAAKGVTSFSAAVDKMILQKGPGWKDTINDLADITKALGMTDLSSRVKGGDREAIARAMALSAAKALKERGGADFTSAMTKALRSNDIAGMRTVMEQIASEQKKIGVDAEKNLDPIRAANNMLIQINEAIRVITAPILGIIATATTGILAVLTSMLVRTWMMSDTFKSIGNWMRAKAGWGAGTAGSQAGKFGAAANSASLGMTGVQAKGGAAANLASLGTAAPKQPGFDYKNTVKKGVAGQVGGTLAEGTKGAAQGGFFGKVGNALGGFQVPNTGGIVKGALKGMLAGVVTVGILAVVMPLLASAVIKVADWSLSLIPVTPEKSKKVAENIVALMGAFADISWAIIKGALLITAIGVPIAALAYGTGGIGIAILAAIMATGAATILTLTPLMAGLAAAVIDTADKEITGRGLDEGKIASKSNLIASVFSSFGSILEAIAKTSEYLGINEGWMSKVGTFLMGKTDKQTEIKDTLTQSIALVKFLKVPIGNFAETMATINVNEAHVKSSANKAQLIGTMFEALGKIMTALQVAADALGVNESFWSVGWRVFTWTDDAKTAMKNGLTEAGKALKEWKEPLKTFADGVVSLQDTLEKQITKIGDGKKLEKINLIFDSFNKIMGTLNTLSETTGTNKGLVGKWWHNFSHFWTFEWGKMFKYNDISGPLDQILKAVENAPFAKIISAIETGIIDPIMTEKFANIGEADKRMSLLIGLVEKFSRLGEALISAKGTFDNPEIKAAIANLGQLDPLPLIDPANRIAQQKVGVGGGKSQELAVLEEIRTNTAGLLSEYKKRGERLAAVSPNEGIINDTYNRSAENRIHAKSLANIGL